jgi:act minimal PKS acyl carrier protein
MHELTLDELLGILTAVAGQGDALVATPDVATLSLEDLGYDSLALLETAAHIEQEYGIDLPEDEITELETLQALLDLVNGSLAARR